MDNGLLDKVKTYFDGCLRRLAVQQRLDQEEAIQSQPSLFWVGGFPAHYMGELHARLQAIYPGLFFLYVSLGERGQAFSHEVTRLPSAHIQVSSRIWFLWTWRYLERMRPRGVLVAGNYPRANLVAAVWAIYRGRDLYYLADSNPLDRRNLERKWLSRFWHRQMFGRVTKILCIGTRNAEFYMQYLPKQRLVDILLPFPLPHLAHLFEAVSSKRGEVFVFLVFGRLEKIKAVDRVISAYALLSSKYQQRSRLLIAGEGAARDTLESQVETLGLRERVDFRGMVSSEKAPQVFGEAHALIVASHDEPWGLVVNEALSAGVPVIGPFWVGAFADLVVPGKTGLVTLDNSPQKLAKAMQELLDNPDQADGMGKAGRELVRTRGWTIEGSVKAFGDLPVLKGIQR